MQGTVLEGISFGPVATYRIKHTISGFTIERRFNCKGFPRTAIEQARVLMFSDNGWESMETCRYEQGARNYVASLMAQRC
jgi:hypothetical protein